MQVSGVDSPRRAGSLALRRLGNWLAGKVFVKLAIPILAAGPFCSAYAEQHQTIWRNSAPTPYTITLVTHSACVINAGPPTFTVKPGGLYGAQISVGIGCQAFIKWQFHQSRRFGDLDATITYTEISDAEGLTGFVIAKIDSQPGKAQHYFQAQCGTTTRVAPPCLGRSALYPPPTTKVQVVFNALGVPADEIVYTGPHWQPMR
jgi:hypothetical protein